MSGRVLDTRRLLEGSSNAKFTPRGGGGCLYWIQGVYLRVGIYEMIYGKHVAPGKHVYWKNDAIMQIEANLINDV